MRGVFQLKGLDDYFAAIQKAGLDVDVAAAKAVDAGGDIMFEAVQTSAAPYRESGELESSISRSSVQQDGNYTFVEVSVDKSGQVDHELFVEYGTSDTPARGFFRSGIDHSRNKVRAKWREIFKSMGLAE